MKTGTAATEVEPSDINSICPVYLLIPNRCWQYFNVKSVSSSYQTDSGHRLSQREDKRSPGEKILNIPTRR